MYVVADSLIQTSFNLWHSVIPLIINYGMAENLQKLLCRLVKSRRGFSATHMAKHAATETRISFIIPLGAADSSSSPTEEQTMNKTQFEDLRVFLQRAGAKAPDVLADLIDLKTTPEFNCTSCYAAGDHRDSCKYDCPQAQEHAVWVLGRTEADR